MLRDPCEGDAQTGPYTLPAMIPQALGFFGWKRPQVAAKTLRGLARCPGIERWPLIAFLDAGSDPATTKAIEQWTASPLLGIRQ